MLLIRAMEEDDIPFAVRLTDEEEWGYEESDFRRFRTIDAGGNLIAVQAGEPVGMTTAVRYGHMGWIGNVIVDARHRRQGIGRHLVAQAMAYLERSGARTIRLNAYEHTVDYYRRFGFVEEGDVLRFHGQAPPIPEGSARPATAADLDAVVRIDTEHFGGDRTLVLRALLHDFPATFLVEEDRTLLGYLTARLARGEYEVGPWVCDPRRPDAAQALFDSLVARMAGKSFAVNVPAASETAKQVLHRAGAKRVMRVVTMRAGEEDGYGKAGGLHAIGGLEKG